MRKFFVIIMATAVAVGCNNDNVFEDVPSIPNNETNNFTHKLVLKVGDASTRLFDESLVWSWEQTDEIVGYQNVGSKSRNTLEFVSDNEFACDAFTYAQQEPADFHFFYADENTFGTLTAVQDGTWRPVLVGTAESTTVDNIGTVEMTHLSAALEFNLYEVDKTTPREIINATLSAEDDFVGYWTVNDDLEYAQTLSGNEIVIENLNQPTVVFNMPTGEFAADTFTLTLTTASGITITKQLPAQTFVAGQRNKYNIATPAPAYLPSGYTFKSRIKSILNDSSCTTIQFIANSNQTGTELDNGINTASDQPIYWVVNESTLEIHTPAPEFMANGNCDFMFEDLANITSIDFNNCLNTSKATSMSGMFQNSTKLESLDLSSLNTSNVTKMSSMFNKCKALQSIIFGGKFDTSNVTTMTTMFSFCKSLIALDLSSFNTSKVTNMSRMFYLDANITNALQSITFGDNFDTSKITDMEHMFTGCNSMQQLDLSGFDTSNVTDMQYMFYSCKALENITFGENFNTSKVTNMSWMFASCYELQELDLSKFDFTSNPSAANIFFCLGYSLTTETPTKIFVTEAGKTYLEAKYTKGSNDKYTYEIVE